MSIANDLLQAELENIKNNKIVDISPSEKLLPQRIKSREYEYEFTSNRVVGQKVDFAINLRRKFAQYYNADNHEAIFGFISEHSKYSRFHLGFVIFLDYLQSQKLFPAFSNAGDENSWEHQIVADLINSVLRTAESFFNNNTRREIKTTENAICTFVTLAYCYKYLYHSNTYLLCEEELTFFNGHNTEYRMSDLVSYMDGLLEKICFMRRNDKGKRLTNTRNITDCLLQFEIYREKQNNEEENQVSFTGLGLLFLKDDQAIKFIIMYFLHRYFCSEDMIKRVNISRTKFMQNALFKDEKSFSSIDMKFADMYVRYLLKHEECDIYGQILRVCPKLYFELRKMFEDKGENFVDALINAKGDQNGYLLLAVYKNEFGYEVYRFEQFAREKLILERHKWLNWYINLDKCRARLKSERDNETIIKLVIDTVRDLCSNYPVSDYCNEHKQYIAELTLDVMLAFIGRGGNIETLIEALGENNLLAHGCYNFNLLKYTDKEYRSVFLKRNLDNVIQNIRDIPRDRILDIYANSALKYVISVQSMFDMFGDIFSEGDYCWTYNIVKLSPEEKAENSIKLTCYEQYLDEEHSYKFEKEWVADNYLNISKWKVRDILIKGIPCRVDERKVYIKADENYENEAIAGVADDYEKVFYWLDIIKGSENNKDNYVYNPFILFLKNPKISNSWNEKINAFYLSDRNENDFAQDTRCVLRIGRPTDKAVLTKFAKEIFDTMVMFKYDKDSLKRLIHFLSDTSLCAISEYSYVLGESLENIEPNEELRERAKKDLVRLCEIDEKHKSGSFEILQNIVNIFNNTYLRRYVSLYSFLRKLYEKLPEQISGLSMVSAYGYEDNFYNSFYYHFKLEVTEDKDKKTKNCYFKQADCLEDSKHYKYAEWRYSINKNRITFINVNNGNRFVRRQDESLFMLLDSYSIQHSVIYAKNHSGNSKLSGKEREVIHVKNVTSNSKFQRVEDLDKIFRQINESSILSNGKTNRDDKREWNKEWTRFKKQLVNLLIEMRILDVYKQRHLANSIQRVIEKYNYDVDITLKFANVILEAEKKTKVKIFDFDRNGTTDEEKKFIKGEFLGISEKFVDESIDKINENKFALGITSFITIYRAMIYNQCIERDKVKKILKERLTLVDISLEEIEEYFEDMC